MQPLRRFDLDAAILFSDIMTPIQGMGVELAFEPGPVVREPIRTDEQIDALPALVPERDVPFVLETLRIVRAQVPRGAPVIGFAGGPFTLLCYLVCGRPSKEFAPARTFLYAQPEAAQRLLTHLADAMAAYLLAQAAAGAQALMLFESWAGLLAPREFTQFALPAVRRTMTALRRAGVPLIYYVNQGSALMEAVADLDVDVIGVDWRSSLKEVRRALGAGKAVQGNLDPAALFARPRISSVMLTRCSRRQAPRPGTFSISVTASGPRPIRTRWRDSWTMCMSGAEARPGEAGFAGWRPALSRICSHACAPRSRSSSRRAAFSRAAGRSPKVIPCKAAANRACCAARCSRKVGVNVSHVHGVLAKEARGQVAGAEELGRPLCRLRHFARRPHGEPLRAGRAPEPAVPLHQPRLVRRRLGSDADLPVRGRHAGVSCGAAWCVR